MLLVVIGKTASGKTMLRNKLVTMGFIPVVTTTTRPKRSGEIDGKDYHFVSDDKFKELIEDGYFMEYKTYNTLNGVWYYGSPLNEIEDSEDKNKIIILTPAGYRDFKLYYPNIKHKSIYLYSNLKTIKNRLNERNDPKESQRRIEADLTDFKGIEEEVDKIFYNNDGQDIDELSNKIFNYCMNE